MTHFFNLGKFIFRTGLMNCFYTDMSALTDRVQPPRGAAKAPSPAKPIMPTSVPQKRGAQRGRL